MEDANDDAGDIIEDEDDASEAAEEVEEVMEDATDAIGDINKDHDSEILKIAKTSFMAELTNDTVMDKVLKDIKVGTEFGADVNDVISEQKLPFNVQTPPLRGDMEPAKDKLDRIVCRNGSCVQGVKKDPEFSSFLEGMLGTISTLMKTDQPDAPLRPSAFSAPQEVEARYRPAGPQRPNRPSGRRGPRGPRGSGRRGGRGMRVRYNTPAPVMKAAEPEP
mmetsp:Transcript_32553/g.40342  ORF Transcript_32553/g.40342 Transcript_32553/m.40342 type:complete len:220 (-) Transcript_32553:220-879(-)